MCTCVLGFNDVKVSIHKWFVSALSSDYGYFDRMLTEKLQQYWKIGLQASGFYALCNPSDKVVNFEPTTIESKNPNIENKDTKILARHPNFTITFIPIEHIKYNSKYGISTSAVANSIGLKPIRDIWQAFLEDTRIISFVYKNGNNITLNYHQKNGFFYNYKNYNDNGLKKLKISDFLFKNILLEESIPNILKSGIIPIKLRVLRAETCFDENLLIDIPYNIDDCDKKFEKLKMTSFEELVENYIKPKQMQNMCEQLTLRGANCDKIRFKSRVGVDGFEVSLKNVFKGKNRLQFNIVYPKVCFNLLIEIKTEKNIDNPKNANKENKDNYNGNEEKSEEKTKKGSKNGNTNNNNNNDNNDNKQYEKYIYFCDWKEKIEEEKNEIAKHPRPPPPHVHLGINDVDADGDNRNVSKCDIITGLYKVDCVNRRFVEISLNCESKLKDDEINDKIKSDSYAYALTLRQLIGQIDSRIEEEFYLYEITHSQSRYLELSFDLNVNRLPFADTIKVTKMYDNDKLKKMTGKHKRKKNKNTNKNNGDVKMEDNDSDSDRDNDSGDDNDTYSGLRCAICLESLNYDNYARLSNCRHKFHFDCICNNVKFTKDNRCPLCRTKFSIIQQKKLIKEKYKRKFKNKRKYKNKNMNNINNINNANDNSNAQKHNLVKEKDGAGNAEDENEDDEKSRFILKAENINKLVKQGREDMSDSDSTSTVISSALNDSDSDNDNDNNDRNRRIFPQWMRTMNFFPNNCDNCYGGINVNDLDFDIDNYLHCIECRKWYCTSCTNASLFAQCDQCMKCIHIDCANQNNAEWIRPRQQQGQQQDANWIHVPCQ